MDRSRGGGDEVVPTWDGSPELWEDFQTDVELYVDGTPSRDRCVCGPRVARRLSGRARAAILGMSAADRASRMLTGRLNDRPDKITGK